MDWEDCSAPALARGIEIIRLLRRETMKLETIAKATGFPKASLLRLLDTLIACGVVSRSPENLSYSLLQDLAPVAAGRIDFPARRQELLEQLSRLAGATCEWYEWRDGAPEICARVEDLQAAIRVKAQMGFRRRLGDELEAVAQVFYSFSPPGRERFWVWSDGVQQQLGKAAISALLKQVRVRGCGVDADSNIHGIVRIAAPVCDDEGRLRVILAMARPFHSRMKLGDEESLRLLQKTTAQLKEILPAEIPAFPKLAQPQPKLR
ncbi:MAG: HTH-type transcriptional regulator YiaJ [Verrucomicrobiota bacterium]